MPHCLSFEMIIFKQFFLLKFKLFFTMNFILFMKMGKIKLKKNKLNSNSFSFNDVKIIM